RQSDSEVRLQCPDGAYSARSQHIGKHLATTGGQSSRAARLRPAWRRLDRCTATELRAGSSRSTGICRNPTRAPSATRCSWSPRPTFLPLPVNLPRCQRVMVVDMRDALLTVLAGLLVSPATLGTTDVSGKRSGFPVYLTLKQDGNTVTGSAGESEDD